MIEWRPPGVSQRMPAPRRLLRKPSRGPLTSIAFMIAVVVTIGLAFAGYAVTYLNGVRLSQRQERLARVNRQLGDFYGPLFALTEANSRTFAAFVERPEGG